MAGTEQVSLFERIQTPSLAKDIAKQIARYDEEFSRVKVDHYRQRVIALRRLVEKRNAILSSPNVQSDFWLRALSTAPIDFDEYLLPDDVQALGAVLVNLTVENFEVDANGQGEPRSVRLAFEFRTGDDNPFFENAKLIKDFYWRKKVFKNSRGKRRVWEGLVSEPVRINWKKDMDLTKGLLDAACDLAEAEKKSGAAERTKLPEYEALLRKIAALEDAALAAVDEDDEEDDDASLGVRQGSFFAFFGYRGRDVSAEASKKAVQEDEERWAKITRGEEVDDDDDDEDDDDDDEEVDNLEAGEIFPDGQDLAIAISEEVWPNAHQYYVQSFKMPVDLSDLDDMDEDDEEDDDDEDEKERPNKKARV